VAHAIESHSYSAAIAAETIEAKIVQDADRLDALGAVGLARLFYTAGRMGTGLAHADDPMALHRELDEKAYAIDHIDTKLATIPGKMQTRAGRQLANTRLLALTASATILLPNGPAARPPPDTPSSPCPAPRPPRPRRIGATAPAA
jgi:uncharacterized protein